MGMLHPLRTLGTLRLGLLGAGLLAALAAPMTVVARAVSAQTVRPMANALRRRVWVMLPSGRSVTRWSRRNLPCASWLLRPMAKP